MGLICFAVTVTGFFFSSVVTFAYFHDAGSACSSNELFRILQTGFARKSEYSLSNQSGPDALRGFNVSKAEYTKYSRVVEL